MTDTQHTEGSDNATPQRVTVWWDDAHGSDRPLDHRDVMRAHRPYRTATTGWLCADDEAGISLAFSWVPQDVEMATWDYATHIFIPRRMVVRVEVLASGKAKR